MNKLFLALFSFAAFVSCSTTPTEVYDVYLLIGQSNMAGRGAMLESDQTTPLEGVYLLDDKGEIEPATSPLNRYSTTRKPLSLQGISPGEGFATVMAQHSENKILLVVNARGGSNIKEWDKDGYCKANNTIYNLYSDAVARCQEAMQYGELKGILWHQGESNSKDPSTYMEDLIALVDNLRRDLGTPEVPFVAGEIGSWLAFKENFNPVIQTISESIDHSDYVRTFGLTPLKDATDPHFGRDAQLRLGERYAAKILELAYGETFSGEIWVDPQNSSLTLPSQGGTKLIEVHTSGVASPRIEASLQWSEEPWCSASASTSKMEVSVTVEKNSDKTARKEILYINVYDGHLFKTIEIPIEQK